MVQYTEFQTVVMAGGKGSRMTELTGGKPKCLLPVCNMPMIFYPLNSLQKAGFTETIVIVTENIKREVGIAIDKLCMDIKMELIGIPDGEDFGTADAIRYIYDKINKDLIVVSCDLIADIEVSEILNSYRKHNASITALMLPIPKISSNIIIPGPKRKQKPETDLIGIDNRTNRLVFLASASDFEESVNISQKLLRKHTSFTMHSKLLDAHFYIINKWVVDFLVYNKSFSTLKGELLPYIVNKQQSNLSKSTSEDKNLSVIAMNPRDDIFRFAVTNDLDKLVKKMSAFNDHSYDSEKVYHGDVIKCYAHISDKFGLRTNTIQMYSFANSKVPELSLFDLKKELISPLAIVKTSQIVNSCIDEDTLVDEKTSIRTSHIGPNAIIKSKTRIGDSIIMQNVTINERCVIQNCILCSGCVIEEGSELRDCLVGAQHVVSSGTNLTREILVEDNTLMEIE
ncbi:hypothetical protein PV327_004923 [Microctonus hyperodae]|uniref:Translation initiation factor eIF2B subunit gamma n=1 Tax=Microctonus hyperodae TaxID=165561 RepID=A0AA39FDG1_MICHY|nr:hypothetical protein PV327_004923 [Microctonus hyperodae]